jgi:hypothetical protein
LISIGCRLDNVITAYNPAGFARAAKKIVVDVDINELDRHQIPMDVKICSSAISFLKAWLENMPVLADLAPWRAKCLDWKRRYTPLDGKTFDAKGPIAHFELADKLSDAIGEGQLVVTGSSGLAVEVFYTAFRNKKGQRMFLTSGLGSMGYGLPAAIGACIGSGGTPTVCVESDGSLMLNSRSKGGRRVVSISRDGGLTMASSGPDPQLIEPLNGCQASLLTYGFGPGQQATLLFANPVDLQHRTNGRIRLSTNNGQSWSRGYGYGQGAGSFTGYSDLARFANGDVGLLVESGASYRKARDNQRHGGIVFQRIPFELIRSA